MKYPLIAIFSTLAFIACAGDAPVSVTVGTNSVYLVPQRPVNTISTKWASGVTNVTGDVVVNSGNYYFTSLGGVTGTNAPTHTSGDASDGGVTWRYMTPGRRGGVLVSVKTSGGSTDLSLGSDDAAVTNGLRLVGEGHALIFGRQDNFQGSIRAVSADGSDVVLGIQEIPNY